MNTASHPRRTIRQALGRLLSAALAVGLLGSVYTPAVAATTTTTVAVDQQPLTLQPSIPPNVTLMLDDSGSMAWDFMPDANYLTGHFTAKDEEGYTDTYVLADALRSSGVNGTYYNPDTTYSAPVHADGTSYPTPTTLDGAYLDPFSSTSSTVPVTQYASPQLCGYNNYDETNASSDNYACPNSLYYAFPYYTAFPTSGNTNVSTPTVSCSTSGDSVDATTGMCGTSGSWYVPTYSCNSSNTNNQYDAATGYCDPGSNGNYIYLFTYTTWDSTTSAYVRHYVGKSSSDCAAAPSSTCVYDATTQQNVATWFSYYRTRILMAKSGLMTAFSTIDPKFRVGFGSIDGGDGSNYDGTGSAGNGNYKNLPTLRYSYVDAYNGGNNYIAEVAPFDTNCATSPTTCTAGQTGTQKANFWNWVSKATVGGGTPLRQALDAVGQYYGDSAGQAWSTMSTDPVASTDTTELACRQSYTILTTDGFWNGNYSSTTTAKASDTSGPTVTGPNNQTATYTAAAPFSGGDTATSDDGPSLADVAMYYWKHDLRSDTANEVPPSTDDSAFWQHMTTFTMGLGFTPTGITGTNASGGTASISDIFDWADNGSKSAITGFSWPTPASNSIYNIADLAHAGVNGHGGFYSATSPATFASGLTDALARAAERVGTGASLAANSTQLTNGTVAYQANYYTGTWKGDLKALSINSSTGAISTTANWSAATMLPAAANRDIWTYTGSQFVQFNDDSSTGDPPALSSAELTALGSTTAIQAQIVNYLRGDGTLEQKNASGIYRSRDTALGDIVDSQPVYSGAPDPNEFENQTFSGINAVSPSTDSFQTWSVGTTDTDGNPVASDAASRTPLVFVAANDGMLHAFNASTGAETFAYLPGAVITAGVANLANTNYGSTTVPHQYYNDGELTIADAYLPTLAQINGSSWHTILVGTTGRGPAKAVYALDVTDPANIKPLWERSAGDGNTADGNSGYIGQMVGKPVIAQVADGDWQVLIGNGYNSANGTAALLEFNLADGTLSVHTTDTTAGNGLAAPVTWMDDASNGISMRAYAGDLAGRVWMFPLDTETTTTSGHGSSATTTDTYAADLTTAGTKVFTATDASGVAQPITAGMIAGSDPSTGNLWLFFGTGRYLSTSDIGSTAPQVQTWYGVIALTGGTYTTNATPSSLVQRSIIYEQDIDLTASPQITLGARVVTPTPATNDITGTKIGWYMNLEAPTGANGALVAQGERMVTPNQFQGNLLLATTRIPVVTDICNPSGSGWVMAVNPFTGTNPASNFFTGGSGGGSITYTDSSGVSHTAATAGVGFSALPNSPIFVGGNMLMSFDNGTTSNLLTAGSTGGTSRVSWQELVNP